MTQSIGTSTPTASTISPIFQTVTGGGQQNIGGLGSGLDTNAIVAALVASKRALENPIKVQGATAQISLQAYGLIRTDLSTLSTAALALSRPANWRPLTATSSDETIATVKAGNGTFGGTLSFVVDHLASAGSVRSANVLSGTTTSVAANATMFVAAGAKAIGFSTLASDSSLELGSHTIEVTQSSAAATKTAAGALASSTLVDGTNDTLNITVNGVAKVLTIAHGTYNAEDLASAVQDAADTAGAAITATASGAGTLSLATTREGSAATLEVTGGNAMASLQLTVDGSPNTGVDGKLTVDDGTAQTFSSLDLGATINMTATTGSIDGVLSGGLRVGSVTGKNVSTGDGSLATVVGAINGAGAGVTATAVQVGTNSYRLQVTSNTAGALNGENITAAAFNANVGGFVDLTTAADAQITVGEGDGAYSVTGSTNTISGLLPGVTVTLVKQSTDPVTITVDRDDAGIAEKVQKLVDAANQARDTIGQLTAYDPKTQQASPLTGDPAADRILSSITNAIIGAVPGADPVSPGLAGLSIDKDGKFTFDKDKFETAFKANPEGVTRLFAQGGDATNANVSFVSAGDRAVAGTYAVNITQAATQATTTDLTGAWPPGVLPTIKVRIGTKEVSYVVKGGDTRADVASGLNTAFASAGFSLQATDTGAGLKITSNDYGTHAKFDTDFDGLGYVTHAGLDVAGTINGQAATGSGQQLISAFSDKQTSGLALLITGTTTGDLGTFTYTPGVAQRVTTNVAAATDLVSGYLTSTENDYKARVKFITDQVNDMELRVTQYETMVRQQWSTLESTLGSLRQQGSFLTSQISGLSANNG